MCPTPSKHPQEENWGRQAKLCSYTTSALCTAWPARPAPAQVLWGPGTFTVVRTVHTLECNLLLQQRTGYWSGDCLDLLGTSHMGCLYVVYCCRREVDSSNRAEDVVRRGWEWWKTDLPPQVGRVRLLGDRQSCFSPAQLLGFSPVFFNN